MKVISTEKVPIKTWIGDLKDIESQTLEQAKHLANLPFVYKWVSLMSDCHLGMGMPIGGVLATKNVIVPNAVGSDISCGVICVKTDLNIKQMTVEKIRLIMGKIREVVPLGFDYHKEKQDEEWMPVFKLDKNKYTNFDGDLDIHLDKSLKEEYPICYANYESARKQLGTLGNGNHFIELQKDNEGIIYIMIHSGSRNLGYRVAKYYNKIAKDLNKKWFSRVPIKWELAFLPMNTREARVYLNEMNYCGKFAEANRMLMMKRVEESVLEVFSGVKFELITNIPHNYVACENHYGKNVWVHRKGATRARKGEIGLTPGSMGSCSYIVEGLGNPESYCSCSHGAGRIMSRTQAKKVLNLEKEKKKMENIICGLRNANDLDEAPGSYKDIETVMENQKDLVKVLVKLYPIMNIKG